jgi:hypothetical protein
MSNPVLQGFMGSNPIPSRIIVRDLSIRIKPVNSQDNPLGFYACIRQDILLAITTLPERVIFFLIP